MKANGKMGLIWFKSEWRTVLVTRKTYLEEKCSISPAYVLFSLTDRETLVDLEKQKRGLCNSVCCDGKFYSVPGLPKEGGRRGWGDNDDRSKAWGFSYVRPTVLLQRVILGWSQEYLNPEQRTSLLASYCRREQSVQVYPNLKQLLETPTKRLVNGSLFHSLGLPFSLKTIAFTHTQG